MRPPARAVGPLLLLLGLSACAEQIIATRVETVIISPPLNSNRFEDERIAAVFTVYQDAIALQIRNKTKAPLRVSWSESSFIDVDGTPRGISHTNLKPGGMQSEAGFTVIPPLGILTDTITLFKRVAPSGQHEVTAPEPLFEPPAPVATAGAVDLNGELRALYAGKSFALMLMIRTDQAIPYRFRFKINDFQSHAGAPRLIESADAAAPQPAPPAPAAVETAPASTDAPAESPASTPPAQTPTADAPTVDPAGGSEPAPTEPPAAAVP